MERLTRLMIRYRWAVVAVWLVVLLGGGCASTKLARMLSNTFTVPGTDSERARTILQQHFGDRSDGEFTVVFRTPTRADPRRSARLAGAARRAARVVPTGHARRARVGGPDIVLRRTSPRRSSSPTRRGTRDDLLRALRHAAGRAARTSPAQAAIQHDLDPIFKQDLRGASRSRCRSRCSCCSPSSASRSRCSMPFLFAASTIMGTLGIVYLARARS